jgi:hypothetical protein
MADIAGQAAATGLSKTAASIWSRITGRFNKDGEKQTVELFKEHPEDMEKMMTTFLQERLKDDADFRKQIQQLVDATVPGTGETAWNLMGKYVGAVDARNATISGNAKVAGVMVNRDGSSDSASATGAGQS